MIPWPEDHLEYKEPPPICYPICGYEGCATFFKNWEGEIFACDECVQKVDADMEDVA